MKNFYKRGMLMIMFLLAMAVLVLFAMGQAKAANMPFSTPDSFQQEITGKVTSPNGQPLLGVTVVVKNKNLGVTTNTEGAYSIFANPGDILQFSFLGYKPVEVQVNNQSTIYISLQEDVAALDEVQINAGYYSVTERERTGNISSLTAEEIENQPVLNPLAAIQGRMAGVEISQTTGVPGGGYEIKIRGTNSLRADGNDPLFIIDGVPFPSNALTDSRIPGANLSPSPLNSINPADIASIEVLKDADATAIYGSRGANGVVLITTKSGDSGKTKFNFNTYTGVGQVSNTMELLSTSEYLELRQEAYNNTGREPTVTGAPDLLVWDQERYTNWQEKLIGGTANLTSFQSSLSGGNETTTFRIGAGLRKETTVFPGSFANKRFSGNWNLRHRSENSRFTGNFSGLYSIDDNLLPKTDLTYEAINLAPNAPALYMQDGSLNWEEGTWTNPLAVLKEEYSSKVYTLVTNAELGYKVLPGLQVSGSFGYTRMDTRQLQVSPQSAFSPFEPSNQRSSRSNISSLDTWIVEPKIDYKNKFGALDLNIIAGGTIQETKNINQAVSATGFLSDELLENLQAGSNYQIINSSEIDYKYRALFGRIHLDYKDKYLINFTGRRDGSSRFGPGKQYASFGAVGAAWIFSEDLFTGKESWLNFGKLRMSYGTTGSDQIGDYEFLDVYRDAFYTYQGQRGFVPVRLANSDFGWEINKKFETGLELGFFNNDLYLSASYYQNRSSNQLVGFPLPGTTGFTSIQYNFPATVENKGLEFVLNAKLLETANFEWNSSLNISIPKNELLEYRDFESSPYTRQYSVGEPLSLNRGFDYVGVNPDTGLYDFRDISGDGFISSPDDLIDITDYDPDYFGGFRNDFRYKNFSLDFLVQFTKQEGPSYYNNFRLPGALGNQPSEIVSRWQEPGDSSQIQRAAVGFGAPNSAYSRALGTGFNITDVSYLRLKNLSLSYLIPIKEVSSRIYFQGQNLFTITDYKGLDPENSGSSALPPLRFYAVGIEINL